MTMRRLPVGRRWHCLARFPRRAYSRRNWCAKARDDPGHRLPLHQREFPCHVGWLVDPASQATDTYTNTSAVIDVVQFSGDLWEDRNRLSPRRIFRFEGLATQLPATRTEGHLPINHPDQRNGARNRRCAMRLQETALRLYRSHLTMKG